MALTLEGNETRHQLVVALLFANQYAKRQPCAIGTEAYPTPWDLSHRDVDMLLGLVVGL